MTRDTDSERLWGVAVHEAGHAAVSAPDELYGDGVADIMRELARPYSPCGVDAAWEWAGAIARIAPMLTTAEFNVFMEQLTPPAVPVEMPMPRATCTVCDWDGFRRADGRPRAHRRDGSRCTGGGAAP